MPGSVKGAIKINDKKQQVSLTASMVHGFSSSDFQGK